MEIPIIYQDNDIVAVNKPAGIAVHKGVADKGETLADWLAEKFPEMKNVGDESKLRPGIVHRLDKDTSGVLIVARNQNAFESLKTQFSAPSLKLLKEGRDLAYGGQSKKIIKKYLALVEGNLKTDKGAIDLPIGRSQSDFRKKLASSVARGELREAVTEYKVLEKFPNYTLVEAYPKTGRTHQIRVHFKAIGHPIVCDSLYGGKRMTCPYGLKRHFLHANFLEFDSPSGARLKLEADLPEDLSGVLEGLRKK